MKKHTSVELYKKFHANSKISGNLALLEKLGVTNFIEEFANEIAQKDTLLDLGMEIFNLSSMDEITEAVVLYLKKSLRPSFVTFLWKPVQIHPDLTVRTYKDGVLLTNDFEIYTLNEVESFFQKNPNFIRFSKFKKEFSNFLISDSLNKKEAEFLIPIVGPFGLYGIIIVGRKKFNKKNADTVNCSTDNTDSTYSKEEIIFIRNFMSFVCQAAKNFLHYENSLRDVKTGLYNHGYFTARLDEEIVRTKRERRASSVLVIDVDKFKLFNDTYGHLAGDHVLEELATVIRSSIRLEDVPSRFGGEEFTVLLPNTCAAHALKVAERLRLNVAKMEVAYDVPLSQVTISIGVFEFDENTNLEMKDVLRRADEALYISKATGRNRCTVWDENLISSLSS